MPQSFENFGKYVLLEKVATGGMAEVYLGRATGANGIGKFFAIKRILPQFSENPEFIEMFKDEAKIASNIQHSNIVSLYEFGIEKNQFYIVIEFVDGKNLRQILNKMKKQGLMLSTEQVLYVIREVAAGLDHAHRCLDKQTGKPLNIIHRDMSPQNIMISFEGESKIIDFGIAKAETQIETTRAGTLKGKFGYMSPEQAEGQNLDVRTDVFSLGIVLWELLANDRLFVANNEVNTLRKIRDCQIPSLRKINPNINPELERIVMKALAKDRNFRYQTAAAFQRDINKFMNRTYPDFSPHDFSLFIKNLFQQEILESRRKQIEYTRVEVQSPGSGGAPTPPSDRSAIEPQTKTGEDTTETDADNGLDFGNRRHTKTDASDSIVKKVSKPRADAPPTSSIGVFQKTPPPTPRAPSDANDAPLRIDRSIREGTHSQYYNTGSQSRMSGYYYYQAQKKNSSWISTTALIVLFGVVIAGILWFQSNPHQAKEKLWTLVGKYIPGIQRPTPYDRVDNASIDSTLINVRSAPGGAQIFVDGKDTGQLTPDKVYVKTGIPVTISLKLQNQEVHRRTINPAGRDLAFEWSIRPQAFLDITVEGNGAIFVDNKLITKSSPARAVPIPADQDVLVKVVDEATNTFDEVRIRVPASETRSIELRPKSNLKRK